MLVSIPISHTCAAGVWFSGLYDKVALEMSFSQFLDELCIFSYRLYKEKKIDCEKYACLESGDIREKL